MKKSTLDFIAKAAPAVKFVRGSWEAIRKEWPLIQENWKPLVVCVVVLLIAFILFSG